MLLSGCVSAPAFADYPLDYELSLSAGSGSGNFAPYYISSLRHGRFTQADNVQAEASLCKRMDESKRFSYGFGVDILGAYSSAVDYERFNVADGSWFSHSERPSSFRIQQLYGELKYRAVFLEAGMKQHESAILTQSLTSGDLVESGNVRPIPQVRVGFTDFQDIPFTNGWVQIDGELAYGRMLDNDWLRNHYNYYNWHITTNQWYNYKRCYFRTKPSERFSVTLGMQAAAEFGGTTRFFYKGMLTNTQKNVSGMKRLFQNASPYERRRRGFRVRQSSRHMGFESALPS